VLSRNYHERKKMPGSVPFHSNVTRELIWSRPGDQHKSTGTSFNPFEEVKPRVTEYTAKEIATLSSRLDKQLGPEYLSSRPGAGGKKVHYVTADKCINLANDVFGFNGWSSGIQNVQVDFVRDRQADFCRKLKD
jgi:DNA repair and recombination protein RAD52